jgi:simple sugar transport system permease protein
VGLVLGILLHFHKFGNWVYATGDNREAARAMGINTDRVKMICFTIVGILCALVAIMQIIRVSSFFSRAGDGWELKAVAASVVGGTSLMGGIGSMVGIFCGTLIIVVIENALTMLRIPYSWTYVVFGLVIIFSVLSNFYMERRRLRYGSLFFRTSERAIPSSDTSPK